MTNERQEVYTDEDGTKVEIDREGNIYISGNFKKEKKIEASELDLYVRIKKHLMEH